MYCMLRWSFQDPESFPPLKNLVNQFDNLWYRVWNQSTRHLTFIVKFFNSWKVWVARWMITPSNIPLNFLFWFPTTFNTGLLSPQMHLLVSQLKISEVLHRIWMKNFNNVFYYEIQYVNVNSICKSFRDPLGPNSQFDACYFVFLVEHWSCVLDAGLWNWTHTEDQN